MVVVVLGGQPSRTEQASWSRGWLVGWLIDLVLVLG